MSRLCRSAAAARACSLAVAAHGRRAGGGGSGGGGIIMPLISGLAARGFGHRCVQAAGVPQTNKLANHNRSVLRIQPLFLTTLDCCHDSEQGQRLRLQAGQHAGVHSAIAFRAIDPQPAEGATLQQTSAALSGLPQRRGTCAGVLQHGPTACCNMDQRRQPLLLNYAGVSHPSSVNERP